MHQQIADEILRVLWHIVEGFVIEIVIGSGNVRKCIDIWIAHKWGQTGKSAEKCIKLQNFPFPVCRRFEYLQNVTNNTNTPHVWLEADRFVIQYFGTNEFGRSKQHTNWAIRFDTLRKSKVDDFYLQKSPEVI